MIGRPKKYDSNYGASDIQFDVLRYMRERGGFVYPLTLAKALGCTRAEARFALNVWVREKHVKQRRDGRYYYDLQEHWRVPARAA